MHCTSSPQKPSQRSYNKRLGWEGWGVTLSEAHTGTTMHCVFILHNLDVMKINYAPTENSTNTFHGNLTHARSESNNAVTEQKWGVTHGGAGFLQQRTPSPPNGRRKDAWATVSSLVAYISVLLQFVYINTYALISAMCGFECAS
jgi:hypothetical protein